MKSFILILGSGSASRKEILSKLGYPFRCISPDIDESIQPHETAEQLVQRLSFEKAKTIQEKMTNELTISNPGSVLIIGSDSVGSLNGNIMGKPHHHDAAMTQLEQMSGQLVRFYSGLCLMKADGTSRVSYETYDVHFRKLDNTTIENYLLWERPYGLAAGFKSEGKGSVLVKAFSGRDINTLMGLPLMQLIDWLEEEGVQCPGPV